MANDPSVQALANEIYALKRQVRALSTSSGLSRSSIEEGAIREFDASGKLVGQYGQQWDGTSGAATFNGPRPPAPKPPTVTPTIGGLEIRWGGEFVGDAVAPMDFRRVEAHAYVPPATYTGSAATLVGTIESPRGGGGTRTLPYVEHAVVLVARSTSGVPSLPSEPVLATPRKATEEDLGVDLAQITGGTKINYGPDLPSDPTPGELWYAEVAPGEYETRRWVVVDSVGSWQALADQRVGEAIASALAAEAAAEAASLEAAGKVTVFRQAGTPVYSGAVNTAVWYDTDDGNRLRTWNGTNWSDSRFGSGSILPNSLVARDVIATGTVSAALLEAVMVLASTLVAGSVNGQRLEIRPDGIYQIGADGAEEMRLAVTGLNHLILAGGAASISSTGDGSFETVSINAEGGLTVGGQTLAEILEQYGRGELARGERGSDTPRTSTGRGIFEVAVDIPPGDRTYRISTSQFLAHAENGAVAGDTVIETQLRYTTNGAEPTLTTGALLTTARHKWQGGPESMGMSHDLPLRMPEGGTIRVLLSVHRIAGTGDVFLQGDPFRKIEVRVDDVGPWRPNFAVSNDGGGTATSGEDSGGNPAPVVSKKKREWSQLSIWNATFQGNGTRRHTNTNVYQGVLPGGDPFNHGNMYGMWGFNDFTGALAGVSVDDIELVEFTTQAQHWWQNSGGQARFGFHNYVAMPTSSPSGSYGALGTFPFNKPEKRTLRVSPSRYAALISGGFRGLTLGQAPTTSSLYYGYFAASARLRIVYYK